MSDEEVVGKAVDPVSEQLVQFYDDLIPVAQLTDGVIYVPIAPIAEALGLTTHGQRNRVLRDEVMAEDVRVVNLLSADHRRRPMLSIPIQQIPGYLFGVDISRIKPELRDKLIRYKRECFDTLWQAMVGTRPSLAAPGAVTLDASPERELTSAEQALALATSVQRLAAAQVEAERRMAGLEADHQQLAERVNNIADYLRPFIKETRRLLPEHDNRLHIVEQRLTTVTENEAAEVALAVKNLAFELEQRGTKNAYGRVYGTMHRKYGVKTYTLLSPVQYQAVLKWLRAWYDEVIAKPIKEQANSDDSGDE